VPAPPPLGNCGAPFLTESKGRTHAREDPRDTRRAGPEERQQGERGHDGMGCAPEALDAHTTVEVAMHRSILILLWACSMCFFASHAAEAGLIKNSPASDFCTGVDHASRSNDVHIKLFRCDEKPNQNWDGKVVGDGVYNIINSNSGLCMGVDHASRKPGEDIKQFTCDGKINQKWTSATCSGGKACEKNVKSGLCIAPERLAHDAPLKQFKCDSDQVWLSLSTE
jgi:hypothetical protein